MKAPSRFPTLVVTAVLLALHAFPARGVELPVKIEEIRLANGMKVFCLIRPGLPQAACALGVRAGAVHEVPGYSGIAHFLEHMMFKGTDKIGVKDPEADRPLRARIDRVMEKILALEDAGAPDDEIAPLREKRDRLFDEQEKNLEVNHIFRIYSEAGGAMTNAFTSNDMTVYFCLLPPKKIELFFWVEGERFGLPVFRQFHAEKQVVREERRLSENRPGHAFREEMNRVIFGDHPYGHHVLGSHEDVKRLTRGDLRRFYETHYAPDNMFLLVAGDVDPRDVFRLARKYFGKMKPFEGKRPRVPTLHVSKAGASRVYGHGKGTPSLSVIYRTPPGKVEIEPEFEILALYLGDPEGALRTRLVEEKGVATSVRAAFDGMRHGGTFDIQVRMKPDRSPEEAEEAVLKAVQRLLDGPLPEDEVRVLARRYRASLLGAFKNDMRVGFLFLRREILGSWRDILTLLERAEKITPEDLHKVATEYLVRDNRVVGIYEKAERASVSGPPSRPEEPKGTARPGASIPASWEDLKFQDAEVKIPPAEECIVTLKNGIRVVVVPDPYDPVFRMSATLTGGSSQDPEGKEGLCGLLASVADRSGLPDMTRKRIRQKLEDLVGETGVSAGFSSLTFSLDTFKADRTEGVKLFKRLILETVLDPEKLEAERARAKSDLLNEDARPRALCNRKFRELLWGKIRKTRRPTPVSLDAITLDDLEKALARHREPRRCIFTVSGDFDKSEMIAELEHCFGDWIPGEAPLPDLSPGKPGPPKTGLHVMDFDASQGFVMIGAPTVPKSRTEFAATRILSRILSRRLFNRIRSREGLAYQAGARLNDDWTLPSLFYAIFQTKARSVPFGISIALEELKKIAEEGPTAEELTRAKRGIATGIQRAMGRGNDRADAFAGLLLHPEAGLDWHRRYWKAARAVDADAVRETAKRHLGPDGLLILCVGKLADMKKGDGDHPVNLDDFGPLHSVAPPAAQDEPRTPREVVQHLIRRISSGDVEGMKPYLAEAYRKRLEEPGAANRMKMQGRMLGRADVKVLGTEEKGDRAVVTVKFDMKMGEQTMSIKMAFELERLGDRWVCAGFKPVQ